MSIQIGFPARVGNFKQGAVVRHTDTGDFGHVVGFDRVYWDAGHEIIIKVLWDDGVVRSIHPTNISLL